MKGGVNTPTQAHMSKLAVRPRYFPPCQVQVTCPKRLYRAKKNATQTLLALQHCSFFPVLEDPERNWGWDQQV